MVPQALVTTHGKATGRRPQALFAITDGNGNTTMEEDTAPIQEYSKFRSGLMAITATRVSS
jgi:hypothetical protein